MFTKHVAFSEFRKSVLKLYQRPLRAVATRYKIQEAFDGFAASTAAQSTADFTTLRLAEFVAGRAAGNVDTTISHLRCLRTVVNFAIEEGWLERPPNWRRIWPRGVPPATKRHLSYDEVCRLLESLRSRSESWKDRRLYALASLVAYTGLRRREALSLELGDVRPSEGFLDVVARQRLKTVGSAAPVPIAAPLVPILEAWLVEAGPVYVFPGERRLGPWDGGAPGYRPVDRLRQAGELASITGLTFHRLRHTLATLMVGRFGASVEQARSVLRHTSTRTTDAHYVHRDDLDELQYAVRNVSFQPPRPSA